MTILTISGISDLKVFIDCYIKNKGFLVFMGKREKNANTFSYTSTNGLKHL